jgi:hypothetical protein
MVTGSAPQVHAAPTWRVGLSARLLLALGLATAVLISTMVWLVSSLTAPAADTSTSAAAQLPPISLAASPIGAGVGLVPQVSSDPPAVTASPSPSSSPSTARGTVKPTRASTRPTPPKPVPSATPPKPKPKPTAAALTARLNQDASFRYSRPVRITISNPGPVAVTGWAISLTFSGSGTYPEPAQANISNGSGHRATLTPTQNYRTVGPHSSISFTLTVFGVPPPRIIVCSINGHGCTG